MDYRITYGCDCGFVDTIHHFRPTDDPTIYACPKCGSLLKMFDDKENNFH